MLLISAASIFVSIIIDGGADEGSISAILAVAIYYSTTLVVATANFTEMLSSAAPPSMDDRNDYGCSQFHRNAAFDCAAIDG